LSTIKERCDEGYCLDKAHRSAYTLPSEKPLWIDVLSSTWTAFKNMTPTLGNTPHRHLQVSISKNGKEHDHQQVNHADGQPAALWGAMVVWKTPLSSSRFDMTTSKMSCRRCGRTLVLRRT